MVSVSNVTATANAGANAGASAKSAAGAQGSAPGDFSRALAGAGTGAGAGAETRERAPARRADAPTPPPARTRPFAASATRADAPARRNATEPGSDTAAGEASTSDTPKSDTSNIKDRQDVAAGGTNLPPRARSNGGSADNVSDDASGKPEDSRLDNDGHADDQPADDHDDAFPPDLAWLTPVLAPLPAALAAPAPATPTPAAQEIAGIAATASNAIDQDGKATADTAPATQTAAQTTPPSAPTSTPAAPESDPVRALAAALRDADAQSAAQVDAKSDVQSDANPGAQLAPADPAPRPAPAATIAGAQVRTDAAAAQAQPAILAAAATANPRPDQAAANAAPTQLAGVEAARSPAAPATPTATSITDGDRPAAGATPTLADATAPDQARGIGVVQPAARAFASSIAATIAQPAALRRTARDGDDPIGTIAGAATTARAEIAGAVGGAPATVDTRQGKWVADIIDHIEVLRDAADAQDTRIRLLPDALGKIDVALQRDGDTVNVRFTADRPETRQLLADAQPRLNDIAAQRGIRIGQSTIESGNGGAQQQQQRQAEQPRQPIANRLGVNAQAEESTDPVLESGWIA